MEVRKSTIDLYDSYIEGNLDFQDIESKYKDDSSLREEIVYLQTMEYAIRVKGLADMKKSLQDIDREMETAQKPVTEKKVFKLSSYKYLLVAASLLGLLVTGKIVKDRLTLGSQDSIYAQYFLPPPPPFSSVRSNQNIEENTERQSAYRTYEQKDYTRSSQLLENEFRRSGDTLDLFYAGISYLGVKDIEKAKQLLQLIKNDSAYIAKFNYKEFIDLMEGQNKSKSIK